MDNRIVAGSRFSQIKNMISCVIISYNEENRIGLVIQAAKRWAEEVIVADKSSTDRTPEIANQLGAIVQKLPYSEQGTENGQDLVARASFDWIICLTAGEIPTPDLIINVKRIIRSKCDSIDLILVPLKYWSFGSHDSRSPWGWSRQPRVFHRKRVTYLNQVHNHLTASMDRTIDLSHHRKTAHILHQTHTNTRQFTRSHLEYMRAEADADANVRLISALGQIKRYDDYFNNCANKMQMHAWKMYWHGVALHCLEKIQDRSVDLEYTWRREHYYALWDSDYKVESAQPGSFSALMENEFTGDKYKVSDEAEEFRQWFLGSEEEIPNDADEDPAKSDSKAAWKNGRKVLFDDPFSVEFFANQFDLCTAQRLHPQAVFWAEKIVRTDPLNLAWINKLVVAYSRVGWYTDAIKFGQNIIDRIGSVDIISKNIVVAKRRLEKKRLDFDSLSPVLCKSQPKVSAIVSVYNAERFLEQCLADLFAQSLYLSGDLEVVVVNTGSEQNECSIVRSFVSKGYCIKYIEVPERETVYSAWNRGIQVANGMYVTSANADDRHQVNSFQILSGYLDANDDVALVYADVDITEEENRAFGDAIIVGQYRWAEFSSTQLLKGCFCGPQPMWRRNIHDELGFFDPSFVSAGDYEMWLRMAVNHKFKHINQVLGLYLKSPLSVEHSNIEKGSFETNLARSRYQEAILKKNRGVGM